MGCRKMLYKQVNHVQYSFYGREKDGLSSCNSQIYHLQQYLTSKERKKAKKYKVKSEKVRKIRKNNVSGDANFFPEKAKSKKADP